MLAFFRRILSSGVAVAILGVILLAFVVTGVGTPGGGLTGGSRPDAVATVGGKPVTIADVAGRAQQELRVAAQQQPGITMPQLLAAIGGAPAIVDQYIAGQVLTRWAEQHGLVAGKRLIDGEIGSIPAFFGPTGQFDQGQMNAVLAQQRLSYPALRDSIRDELLRRQLLTPITTGARAPAALLNPYAALLLARHEGAIGLVAASTAGLPAPTDGEIAAWYGGHQLFYSLPERRVVHYAPIDATTIAVTPPSDAEIAAAYRADAAKYAANETRAVSQVVLPDEVAAKAFAGKIAAGTPFAKAATDAGFAPADIALGSFTKDALARAASPAVADAVFAAKAGGTTHPTKTDLGWAVDHVDGVAAHAARSLAQARDEIAAALTKKKADAALATLVEHVQDALNDGASFSDLAAKQKLQVVTTPPVIVDGTAPADPSFKPDPTLVALMKVAKDMGPSDPPSLETVGGGKYALVGVASVVRAAPLPLAQVKARVTGDLLANRAATRARATADAILAQVAKGQAMAAAFAAQKLPAPQPIALTQVQLSQAGDRVPPVVRALFRLAPGKTEVVAAPGGGWFVARLDRIVPGDAAALPAIAAATRGELGRSLGEEYAEQFADAARKDVTVRRNPAAMAELERQLRGGAPQ